MYSLWYEPLSQFWVKLCVVITFSLMVPFFTLDTYNSKVPSLHYHTRIFGLSI